MDMQQNPIHDRPLVKESPRDTLARLYREIGIAAVAAALEIPQAKAEIVRVDPKDVPAFLREESLAA